MLNVLCSVICDMILFIIIVIIYVRKFIILNVIVYEKYIKGFNKSNGIKYILDLYNIGVCI